MSQKGQWVISVRHYKNDFYDSYDLMTKEQEDERSVARDDGFCTGAGLIKQKYVSAGFSV